MIGKRRMMPVLGVAIALLVAACGSKGSSGGNGGSSKASLAALVASSSTKTQAEGSARMSLHVNVSGASTQAGSKSFSEIGSGVFDFARKEGQISIALPQLQSAAIEILYTNGALYERLPPQFGAVLARGKQWIKVDLSAAGNLAALNPSLGASTDPTQVLNYLRGASNSITEVGKETLRGASTTHYHVDLDLTKAARRLSAGARRAFEQGLSAIGGATSVPADVWIDDQGRLRKFALRLSITPRTGNQAGQTFTVSETIELYDFGVPVSVTAPPASQVTDLTSSFANPAGSGGGSPSP
jgi:hypothetical protein